jgi:hypothetical protein
MLMRLARSKFMFGDNRGYSLAMWTAVFLVAVAGMAIFFVPVKRAITAKVMNTTDHAIWGLWANQSADDVKQDGGRNRQQIGAMQTDVTQVVDYKITETPESNTTPTQVKVDSTATSEYTSGYSSY